MSDGDFLSVLILIILVAVGSFTFGAVVGEQLGARKVHTGEWVCAQSLPVSDKWECGAPKQ